MSFLLKLLFRQVLTSPDLEKMLFSELRDLAKATDNKFDDSAVDTFEAIWRVAIPIVIGKL